MEHLTSLILGVLATIIGAVVIAVTTSARSRNGADDVSLKLFDIAVKLLSKEDAEFFAEAWLADICSIEQPARRISFALGLINAAITIRASEQIAVPAKNALVNFLNTAASQMQRGSKKFTAYHRLINLIFDLNNSHISLKIGKLQVTFTLLIFICLSLISLIITIVVTYNTQTIISVSQ
ncbi:MAG: hypothetical protein WA790_16520 [Sulfitobacter sp.]